MHTSPAHHHRQTKSLRRIHPASNKKYMWKSLREPVERVVKTMAALMREPTRMKAVEVSLHKQGRKPQTTG